MLLIEKVFFLFKDSILKLDCIAAFHKLYLQHCGCSTPDRHYRFGNVHRNCACHEQSLEISGGGRYALIDHFSIVIHIFYNTVFDCVRNFKALSVEANRKVLSDFVDSLKKNQCLGAHFSYCFRKTVTQLIEETAWITPAMPAVDRIVSELVVQCTKECTGAIIEAMLKSGAWHFRGMPAEELTSEFEFLLSAVLEEAKNRASRPVSHAKKFLRHLRHPF